jgi:succinate dehydrogenase / fumarate reductase, flavoprotein subunit
LPRDIVARAIHSEVKAGRGSPHGGVFLDIATRRSAEDIKRKLPAMYHQFKELGDVDITKEPMEVGPTAHYTMGGIRVDPETQESRVKGLFAAASARRGCTGRTGSAATRCRTCSCSGASRAARGEVCEGDRGSRSLDDDEIEAASREALAAVRTRRGAEPLRDPRGPQGQDAELRRDHPQRGGPQEGARAPRAHQGRDVGAVKVDGNRHYNAGWHQTIDMRNMLIVSEAMARAALARKESRGGHAREDFPTWTRALLQGEHRPASDAPPEHAHRGGAACPDPPPRSSHPRGE